MIRALLFTIILLPLAGTLFSQESTVNGYHPPLAIPLVLSANFGELRPNHFHMGLDFKTNLKEGYRIYSIADGYVSRIKVSPYGYGKVVYIDHPDGRTSVYAHCSEFKGKIDSIVLATQKSEQNFEVEIFPRANELPVKRGEVIALSGNTGGSSAPHLHFEIRDTKTEHALNPLLCGFDIADTKAPTIRNLKIYALTKDGYRYPDKTINKTIIEGKSGYYVSGSQVIIPSDFCSSTGGIGFAVDVIDRFDAASNQCGLFGSLLIVDGDTIFGQQSDRIPFESTRYVNSHKDYEAYSSLKRKYHKLYRTTENDLPIYKYDINQGILKVKPGEVHSVRYIAFDVKGNKSEFSFELVVQQGAINPHDTIPTSLRRLHPQETYVFTDEDLEIECGYATVYEPVSVDENAIDHKILTPETAVNRTYKIKIKAPENYNGKSYLEMTTAGLSKKAFELVPYDGWLIAECNRFGNYVIKTDTIGPHVVPMNFTASTNIFSSNKLVWKITENGSGIADYDLFIDGEWYVLEYESKGDLLIFNRPKEVVGTRSIRIIARDKCGNETKWSKELTFNP